MTGRLGDDIPLDNNPEGPQSVIDTAQAIPRVDAPLAEDGFAAASAAQKSKSIHDDGAGAAFGSGLEDDEHDAYGLPKDEKVMLPGLVSKMNPKTQERVKKWGWKIPAIIAAVILIFAISIAGHFATRSLDPNKPIGQGNYKQQTVPNSKGQPSPGTKGDKDGKVSDESKSKSAMEKTENREPLKNDAEQQDDSQESISTGAEMDDPNKVTFRERQIIGAPPVPSASGSKAIPKGALAINQFSTPDGNIQCEITNAGVNCIMNKYNFDFGCSQGGKGAISILIQGKEGFTPDCYDPTNVKWPTLGTNKTTAFAPFACTAVESGGVSCWNSQSGWGFSMSRSGVQQYMPTK